MTPIRHPRLLITVALLSGVALMLAACGSSSSSDSGAEPATELAGTSWVLQSYAGADGATVPATAESSQGSLTFVADGTFNGSTGCNRLAGTYTQDGTSLTMQAGPMTMMACSGAVAEQETAVVAALPEVASFTSGATLVLQSSDGSTLLTYVPGLSGLAGTSWQATGINNGKEAVVGMAGTEKVTASFGTDGQLSGSGGCNTYSATYETSDPDVLVIGPIAATAMACTEDTTSQIEQEYFAALDTVTTYQIDADRLTLRDSSGATQVTYVLTS
jgi:heat shock protein HslJ